MSRQSIPCPHCQKPTLLTPNGADQSPVITTESLPAGFAPRFNDVPDSWNNTAEPRARKFHPVWIWASVYAGLFILAIFGNLAGRTENDPMQTAEAVTRSLFGAGLILGLVAVYFAPTLVARQKAKKNTIAIFILNLFLGWTLIGWVIALVWANLKES